MFVHFKYFFLFFNLISTDCRPYRWGFVTTLWRLSCGAGFRRKLLKLHTISGGNYACIYVIVNCLNNTPLAVRLFNVCMFGAAKRMKYVCKQINNNRSETAQVARSPSHMMND